MHYFCQNSNVLFSSPSWAPCQVLHLLSDMRRGDARPSVVIMIVRMVAVINTNTILKHNTV